MIEQCEFEGADATYQNPTATTNGAIRVLLNFHYVCTAPGCPAQYQDRFCRYKQQQLKGRFI